MASCAVLSFKREYALSTVRENYNLKPVSKRKQAKANAANFERIKHMTGYADTTQNILVRNFKSGNRFDYTISKNGRLTYSTNYSGDTVIYREYAYPGGELVEEKFDIGGYTIRRIIRDSLTYIYTRYKDIDIGCVREYKFKILYSEFCYTDTSYESTKDMKYRGDGIVNYWYYTPNSGIKTYYYPNGNVEHMEFWKNSEKDSVWTYYNESGVLIKSVDITKE